MDCDYCSESFDNEENYLQHLGDEHYEELGRIQKRRVNQMSSSTGSTWLIVGGVVIVLALLGGGYLLMGSGGDNSNNNVQVTDIQPSGLRSVHYHGTISVVIDGNRIDFSQRRYQVQDDYFHFEQLDGTRWHVHGRDVTLGYAMDTLGITVTEDTVIFQGTTYSNASVQVDGQNVDPSTYVLKRGDNIEIRAG